MARKRPLSKAERKKQAERAKQKRLRARQIRDRDLVGQYSRKLPPFSAENFKWRVEYARYDSNAHTYIRDDISGFVESVTWQESADSSGFTGTLSIRRPDIDTTKYFGDGHLIIMSVSWAGKWQEIWRMRVWKPSEQLPDNTATFELADDFKLLAASRGDFVFGKSKKHGRPHGYKSHEIIRRIAKAHRIPLGRIPKGNTWMTIDLKNKSVTDAINKVYAIEREKTGRRYVSRWVNGKLYVVPLQRQPFLYDLDKQIRSATITTERDASKFMTAAMVSASYPVGKGRKKKKTKFLVVDTPAVRRYGFIRKNLSFPHATSRKDAIKSAKASMARTNRKQVLPTISIEHEGIPFIRRGDGVRVIIKQFGIDDAHKRDGGEWWVSKAYRQRMSIMFVSSITHTITGNEYVMTPELAIDDPVANYHDEYAKFIDKKKRKAKAKARNNN